MLVACGGGGGGSDAPEDPGIAGSPYFPLSEGSRWRTNEQGALTVSHVSATLVIDGSLASVVTSVEGADSFDEYFVKSASGIRQIAGPASDEFTRQIGPVDMVRFPLRTGSSYVAVDKALPPTFDVDGDRRADALSVKLDVTVVGFERVVLPVGSFDNCLHLRSVFVFTYTLSSNGQRVPVTVTSEEWFAADIGLVKSTTSTVSGNQTQVSESTLVTYRVGSNRGNAGQAAPTVTLIEPSGPAAVGPHTAVVFNFSDDIDPTSLGASTVKVSGPTGSTIAGAISWTNARTLKFTPTQPLADGSHSIALLAGATDQFGVALVPQPAAAFMVDAVAPRVEVLTPTADSLVSSAQIAVRFSEPMNREAAPPVISVTGPGGTPFTGFVNWQDERTLAIVALSPLASGSYTANLAPGATDLAGNAVDMAVQWQFTIDATGPTLVSALPADGAEEVAVGSELRVTFDEPIDPRTVSATTVGLYRNSVPVPAALRVEGSAVVLAPAAPLLRGVAYVLRLDGGVTDNLGNRQREAFELQFVTDSGRFALPQQLSALDSQRVHLLKLGDLDGDGLQDLLVSQSDNTSSGQLLRVPRRADGALASSGVAIPTLSGTLTALTVGDFSGDGLNDFAGDNFQGGQDLYVQSSGGRFVRELLGSFSTFGSSIGSIVLSGSSRPGLVDVVNGEMRLWRPAVGGGMQGAETLPTGSSATPVKVVVGDINGDGRQDLVTLAFTGSSRSLVVWTQRSDAGFDVQTLLLPRAGGSPLAIADFDGDGRQDVTVAEGAEGLRILRQTSSGTQEAGELITLPFTPNRVQVLDYNGDGRLDIVVQHGILAPGDVVRFSVALRQAVGTYQVINPFDFDELPAPLLDGPFLVADFTGDGRLDFLVGQFLLRQKSPPTASAVQPGLKQPAATTRKRARISPPLF